MYKFIVGFLLGCIISLVFVSAYFEKGFDGNFVVNLVIAFAACIATAIQAKNTRDQHKERIWQLNKPILLELADSFQSSIKSYEIAQGLELAAQENGSGVNYKDLCFAAVDALNSKIEYALSVYAPLMSQCLVKMLEQHKIFAKENTDKVFNGELDNIEGYENLIEQSKVMHKEILNLIAQVSGIKNSPNKSFKPTALRAAA